MKTRLAKYYIYPNSYIYQLLDYLNQSWWKIGIAIIVMIVGYPAFYCVSHYYQYRQLEADMPMLSEKKTQRSALLSAMQKRQREFTEKDANLAEITQQIKSVLTENSAEVESIQWQFLDEKYIYVTANQQANELLNIIHLFNQIDRLKFKEVSLVKLHKNKLVQLNATLVLNE